MTLLKNVQAALQRHGYFAEQADEDLFDVLKNDLAESDVFDLQNTWRNDWKSELRATLDNAEALIAVHSPVHSGVAVFGASRGPEQSAQMWLLQSVSFSQSAEHAQGAAWALKAVEMSRQVVALFRDEFGTVFNFKNQNQHRSIKWLQMCGFEFYRRNDVLCDTLFFGLGPLTPHLANTPAFWQSYLGASLQNNPNEEVLEIAR